MSKISVDIIWNIGSGDLSSGIYSNKHEIKFNSKIALPGDSAPDWKGDPNKTNPEQNVSRKFKSSEIFQASDMMVESLTQLLDRERNKRKAS